MTLPVSATAAVDGAVWLRPRACRQERGPFAGGRWPVAGGRWPLSLMWPRTGALALALALTATVAVLAVAAAAAVAR